MYHTIIIILLALGLVYSLFAAFQKAETNELSIEDMKIEHQKMQRKLFLLIALLIALSLMNRIEKLFFN